MNGDLDGWEAGHRATAAAARAADDRLVVIHALGALGIPLEWQGRLVESEAAFRESAEIARDAGRAYRVNWGLVHLAIGLAWQGRGEEADRALAAAKAAYHDTVETISWYASWVWWLVGDRRAAAATTAELVTLHPAIPRRMLPAVVFGAAAAAEAAQPAEAQLFLDRVEAALAAGPWFGFDAVATWARGVAVRFRDGPEAALPIFDAASERLRSLGYLPKLTLVLADLAEAAALAGRADAARQAARLLQQTAAKIDVGPFAALGSLADGWANLVRGARVEAASMAGRAADGLTGWPAYRARALAVQAEALSPTDRPAAVAALNESAGLLGAIGGEARRREVLGQLAGLGPRGRRAAAQALGPGSLTARERQVARLAAQGLTAAEIGARLFVGERTVETHLSRAYAKLGVASKRELARRAAELGL